MPAYMREITDSKGDVTDREFYCEWCRPQDILPWPCYPWPSYDVYCVECDDLIHKGEES